MTGDEKARCEAWATERGYTSLDPAFLLDYRNDFDAWESGDYLLAPLKLPLSLKEKKRGRKQKT